MPGERVRITDVSARDGLQNEPGVIPTAEKVRLVELLSRTGVDEVEVSSFVSPRWVPQLGDAAEVFAGLSASKPKGMVYSALVPNEKGMLAALEVNRAAGTRLIDKVAVFTAASETFSRKNTNAGIAETIERFRPVVRLAAAEGLGVRVYVSCVIACPFEGEIAPSQVVGVLDRIGSLRADGDITEIDLGDTIGAGTPEKVRRLLAAVREPSRWGAGSGFVLHLHDTFGRAAECVRAGLEMGVRSFDGSVAGLGGCPYASTPGRRAPGNISAESLVRTVEEAGFSTGVALGGLGEAAAFAREIVGRARDAAAGAPGRGG